MFGEIDVLESLFSSVVGTDLDRKDEILEQLDKLLDGLVAVTLGIGHHFCQEGLCLIALLLLLQVGLVLVVERYRKARVLVQFDFLHDVEDREDADYFVSEHRTFCVCLLQVGLDRLLVELRKQLSLIL